MSAKLSKITVAVSIGFRRHSLQPDPALNRAFSTRQLRCKSLFDLRLRH